MTFSAQDIRGMYANDTYIQGLEAVEEAIKATAKEAHRVVVDIPTGTNSNGEYCEAYHVVKNLQTRGFEVNLVHDPENGSSELTIRW